MDRRTFNTALMGAAVTSLAGCATSGAGGGSGNSGRSVFYQGVGDRLTQFDVDTSAATLTYYYFNVVSRFGNKIYLTISTTCTRILITTLFST